MGCIVCCPAVYLVGLLPWQPAPDWPGSLSGLWMRRSAAVCYPGRPDTVQKLCAPAGLSHNHRGPTPPEQRTRQGKGQVESVFTHKTKFFQEKQSGTLIIPLHICTPGPQQHF